MPDKIPGFGGGRLKEGVFFVCAHGLDKKSLSLSRRFLNLFSESVGPQHKLSDATSVALHCPHFLGGLKETCYFGACTVSVF